MSTSGSCSSVVRGCRSPAANLIICLFFIRGDSFDLDKPPEVTSPCTFGPRAAVHGPVCVCVYLKDAVNMAMHAFY